MFVDRFSEVMRAVKWHFKSLLLTDVFFFFYQTWYYQIHAEKFLPFLLC